MTRNRSIYFTKGVWSWTASSILAFVVFAMILAYFTQVIIGDLSANITEGIDLANSATRLVN